jgi:spermidine/putrescine transport system ATP-binding protein
VMNHGQIEDLGPPQQIYLRPASLFSAGFMGEISLIPATATPDGLRTPLGDLPIRSDLTGGLMLCLRPESLGLAGDIGLGQARLTSASFFGTHLRCHFAPLSAPEIDLIAHLPQSAQPQIGSIHALFASSAVVLPA